MSRDTTHNSLRSRKLDYRRQIPVFKHYEVPDLDESASINRSIVQVATGVEKEEEEEHHLQAALIASQTGRVREQVIIPTPDASRTISDYGRYYSSTFHQPPSLIRFSTTIEDVIGCPYNLDEADDAFIAEHRSKIDMGEIPQEEGFTDDQFEDIMWALERSGDDKVSGEPPSLDECRQYIETEEPSLTSLWPAIQAVYPHWKERRYVERGGLPIQPKIKLSEDWLLKPDNDPYVCFRRREVKMLRKTRGTRTDSQSLDKLRRLRDEMSRAKQILEMITNREAARKESIVLEHLIFEQRVLVRRLKKKLGIVTSEKESDVSPDIRKRKLKKTEDFRDEPSIKKIRIPAASVRAAAQMVSAIDTKRLDGTAEDQSSASEGKARRKKIVEESQGWVDITENPYVPRPRARAAQCWQSDIGALRIDEQGLSHDVDHFDEVKILYARRRLGRGGRVLLDRHVKQKVWMKTRGGKTRPLGAGLRDRELRQLKAEVEQMDTIARKWRFDDSDDEVDEDPILEVEDTASQMAYRVFNIGPLGEQEILALMNAPAYPKQMAPQPKTASQRAEEPPPVPPQVIRNGPVPMAGSVGHVGGINGIAKKRVPKIVDAAAKPPSAAAQKKRQEMMDPKQTIIKAMMAQAQRQAQQTQQHYAQMQQAAAQQALAQQQHMHPPSTTASMSIAPVASSSAAAPSPVTPSATLPNGTLPVGTPQLQAATPVMAATSAQASPSTKIASSFVPTASMPIQASVPMANHPALTGAQAVVNANLINNRLRQQQVQQQLHQHQQQQQQQYRLLQQQQLAAQRQQQSGPQQAQAQQAMQTANLTPGIMSPNPNGFTPQQLLYYQSSFNSPMNQMNLQQQARAQTHMRMGGISQATIGALMSGPNPQLTPQQLQAYLQQHHHQQQGHLATTNLSLQQHLLNQQKLKAAASGAVSNPSTALPANGVATTTVGVNGTHGYAAQAMVEPTPGTPVSSTLPTTVPAPAHQQILLKNGGATSATPASPAPSVMPNGASSSDVNIGSDKENGPTPVIPADHAGLSPHPPATKTAA